MTARRLLVAFVLLGIVWGVWQVLLPGLTARLSISPGLLGLFLSIGVACSLPVMALAGRQVDRHSGPRVAVVAGLCLCGALAAYAFVPEAGLVAPVVVAFYAASGAFDVAINAHAMRLEQETGRSRLPVLHAGFSAGGAGGALLAGAWIASTAPVSVLYPLAGAGIAAVLVTLLRGAALRSAQIAAGSQPSGQGPRPRSPFLSPVLVVLAAAAALSFLSEGAMESWSAIYLRDALGVSLLVGASGVAVFHSAMTGGRLALAAAALRFNRIHLLFGGGLAVVAGMLVVLTAGSAAPVLGGILLVGLGLSTVAPVCFSLGADASGGRTGAASSVITVIGYAGFLIGPALIGSLAQLASLREALIVVLLAGVGLMGIAALTRLLLPHRARDPATTP